MFTKSSRRTAASAVLLAVALTAGSFLLASNRVDAATDIPATDVVSVVPSPQTLTTPTAPGQVTVSKTVAVKDASTGTFTVTLTADGLTYGSGTQALDAATPNVTVYDTLGTGFSLVTPAPSGVTDDGSGNLTCVITCAADDATATLAYDVTLTTGAWAPGTTYNTNNGTTASFQPALDNAYYYTDTPSTGLQKIQGGGAFSVGSFDWDAGHKSLNKFTFTDTLDMKDVGSGSVTINSNGSNTPATTTGTPASYTYVDTTTVASLDTFDGTAANAQTFVDTLTAWLTTNPSTGAGPWWGFVVDGPTSGTNYVYTLWFLQGAEPGGTLVTYSFNVSSQAGNSNGHPVTPLLRTYPSESDSYTLINSPSATLTNYGQITVTAMYPYTVNYYKGSVSAANLLGTAAGVKYFAAGTVLTAADVATDLGPSWLNAKEPASGYGAGAVSGSYPTISATAANNVVNVVYPVVAPAAAPVVAPAPASSCVSSCTSSCAKEKKECSEPAKVAAAPAAPQTGDDSNALLWAIVLLASSAALVLMGLNAKERRDARHYGK
jgi:hypothetical protein